MSGYEAIRKFLEENLTPEGLKAWDALQAKIPHPVWKKDVSSSGKYHLRADGSMPSISEHTLSMLQSGKRIMRCLGQNYEEKLTRKNQERDVLFIGIAFHDALKYGREPGLHTIRYHDHIAADFIRDNEALFVGFSKDNLFALDLIVREHNGRWSGGNVYNQLNNQIPIVLFVHFLDMADTGNLLKEVRINNE